MLMAGSPFHLSGCFIGHEPLASCQRHVSSLPANRRLRDLLHLQQIDFQVLKLATS